MVSLFVNKLSVIDFSYLDTKRGIVGESWLMDVTLIGDLNDESMVFDFGLVKPKIKSLVDALVDHKLLIPTQLPGLDYTLRAGEYTFILRSQRGQIDYSSPEIAVCAVDAAAITPESMQPFLRQHIRAILPDNVQDIEVSLRPESIDGPYYHYSHGLKKHQGDCQRICHGHRSRIEITRDGSRDVVLEKQWAQRWQDIYLVTAEDIQKQNSEQISIAYTADQGKFSVSLPATHCEVLPSDSTVELIAEYIANKLKKDHPNSQFIVKAYEGVDKGAIALS